MVQFTNALVAAVVATSAIVPVLATPAPIAESNDIEARARTDSGHHRAGVHVNRPTQGSRFERELDDELLEARTPPGSHGPNRKGPNHGSRGSTIRINRPTGEGSRFGRELDDELLEARTPPGFKGSSAKPTFGTTIRKNNRPTGVGYDYHTRKSKGPDSKGPDHVKHTVKKSDKPTGLGPRKMRGTGASARLGREYDDELEARTPPGFKGPNRKGPDSRGPDYVKHTVKKSDKPTGLGHRKGSGAGGRFGREYDDELEARTPPGWKGPNRKGPDSRGPDYVKHTVKKSDKPTGLGHRKGSGAGGRFGREYDDELEARTPPGFKGPNRKGPDSRGPDYVKHTVKKSDKPTGLGHRKGSGAGGRFGREFDDDELEARTPQGPNSGFGHRHHRPTGGRTRAGRFGREFDDAEELEAREVDDELMELVLRELFDSEIDELD